jgi:hypothetical protein
MKRLIQMFWINAFWVTVRHLPWRRRTAVGARTITELSTKNTQVTLTVWDLTNPKYTVLYSREELIIMLEVIRQCERNMGWKVPEPKDIP